MPAAAAVVGSKIVDEVAVNPTVPKNSPVTKPNAGANVAGEGTSAGKGTTTAKTSDVTEIKYQIPAKDSAGNIIGYKDKPLTKTIYNPKIVSDQKILDLGQQAAASGYKSAITSGAREYISSAGGISFRVYLDPKTGTVTNFFPVTK